MRNELIEKSDFSDPEKNKLRDVLLKSRDTALQRYEHPFYDTELGLGTAGWYKMVSRTPVQYTPQQFSVFRAVHKWRDDVAREEDESPVFILPPHAIFSIARSIPEDKAALFNVVQHVSHFLRVRADELVKIINEAKAVGDDAPDLNNILQKVSDLKFAGKEQSRPLAATTKTQQSAPAPALQEAPQIVTLDTPPLRAPSSTFWGSLWGKGAPQQKRLMSTLEVNLAVPLPPLTAEIFADPSTLAETPKSEQPKPTFVPKEERPKEDERSDIFVVKQLGGKRKRGQADAGGEASTALADQADQVMFDHSGDEKATRKAEKEQRKKEAKMRKQQRRKSQLSDQPPGDGETLDYGDEGAEEEQPFDYASAPSVLRAQEAEREREKGGGKKKRDKKKPQGFNPYAKLTDVPKGLPRTNKETAGRSKTFSS
jgi:exosome complex exonuclease RRP6